MNFYQKRTAEKQANRLPKELRQAYLNSQIDRITIFDGTEELEVTGYAEYSYLDEKSYKTQPIRTQDGAIQEIEEYATFLTPRLIIKYNMMGIEDYRSLMKMLKRRNGYIVKCYDVVEDKIVKNEMYVAPPSMPRIFQQYLAALGVQEYTIELIGTNVSIFGENATEKITFDIAPVGAYNANLGYTWRDWVSSKYNTDLFSLELIDGDVGISSDGGDTFVCLRGNIVKADDYIFKDVIYDLLYFDNIMRIKNDR